SGGQARSSTDGLADGKTSLREALNTVVSGVLPVHINFNIPTSDPGYRDYDDPDTPSSGDGQDGDDYWTFRPMTDYFTAFIGSSLQATANMYLDATTQTVNQGNTNTEGPEIEISGKDGTAVDGFNITKGINIDAGEPLQGLIKGLV